MEEETKKKGNQRTILMSFIGGSKVLQYDIFAYGHTNSKGDWGDIDFIFAHIKIGGSFSVEG